MERRNRGGLHPVALPGVTEGGIACGSEKRNPGTRHLSPPASQRPRAAIASMSPMLKSASLHGVSSSSLQRPSVRCAAFDNKVEVKRPAMPATPPSPLAEPPKRLFNEPAAPSQAATSPSTAPVQHAGPSAATPSTAGGVTVEYQRQRAKEMTKYFKELKLNEAIVKSQVFGWTKPNEISNGRWVMFGLMVGMLTEYATGVDFPHQLLLMCSYLGIVDAE